jgi:hypothetical protein
MLKANKPTPPVLALAFALSMGMSVVGCAKEEVTTPAGTTTTPQTLSVAPKPTCYRSQHNHLTTILQIQAEGHLIG